MADRTRREICHHTGVDIGHEMPLDFLQAPLEVSALSLRTSAWPRALRFRNCGRSFDRECKAEHRAASGAAHVRELSIVLDGDALGDGQTEARACGFVVA